MKISNRAVSMFLIYSPDGTSIYSARGVEFDGAWWVSGGLKAVKSCS